MIPYFGDRTELLSQLDVKPDEVCVFAANRAGQVLAMARGSYDPAAAASLLDALGQGPKVTAGGP